MIKALLVTAMFTLFSSTAEAHDTCYTQKTWRPGTWHIVHRGTPYEEARWVDGYWVRQTVCPPPPPQRPVIRITVPPVFPHVGHRYRGYSHRHQSHPHRHHNHSHRHRSHSHRR